MANGRGAEVLRGVGNDILNPERKSNDAYDEMLRALHEVVEIKSPSYNRPGNVAEYTSYYMDAYYQHLEGIIEGATKSSSSDLMELAWPGKDWEHKSGEFQAFTVLGSNPLYQLSIDMQQGVAKVKDFENGKLRRVGQRTLLSMNPDMHNSINRFRDFPLQADERSLSMGYVMVPAIEEIDIKSSNGVPTGESVRRALYPHSDKIASIAGNLIRECQLSEVAKEA